MATMQIRIFTPAETKTIREILKGFGFFYEGGSIQNYPDGKKHVFIGCATGGAISLGDHLGDKVHEELGADEVYVNGLRLYPNF